MTRFLYSTAALSLVLGLTGCAGTEMGAALNQAGSDIASGFESLTSGAFFSDGYLRDQSDVCIGERRALAEHGSYFDKTLVLAALTGAATGGLLAAVSGENILLGAVIGGAVGLAGGYLLKMQQQGMSADTIIGHTFDDVQTENRKIDALLVSFRHIKECRIAEGRAVQKAYDSAAIDKAQAQERMAAVRLRYNEDVAKFDEIAKQISENSEAYTAVYNEIAADNGTRSLEVQNPRDRRNTPEGSLQASNKRIVGKLKNECLTNVRKRDECIEEIQESKEKSEDLQLDLG